MQSNSLTRFIIKVFLWLPICYSLWYSLAPYTSFITSYLTELLLKTFFNDLVLGVDKIGYNLEIIVKATLPPQDIPKGMVAELPYPINPLIYNYGLPLCLALILSSPDKLFPRMRNIVLSLIILLFIQIWGVCFEFFKSLFLQTPSHMIGNYSLSVWLLDLIAISYQIGTLVLPPVAPLVIWMFLYKGFITQFIPALQQPDGYIS